MSIFKQNAEMRTAGLKSLLKDLENKRDILLDEVAEKRGRANQVEEIINSIYERILDINKEEQNKELQEVKKELEKNKREEEVTQKQKEKEKFEGAKKGIKTPRKERRNRNK